MDLQTKILGALILTYFTSRLTLRLPIPPKKHWSILLAHAIALAAIVIGIRLLRSDEGSFAATQLLVYISPAVFWCLLDLLREHRIGLKAATRPSRNEVP